MSRILNAINSNSWAIQRETLQTIVDISQRENLDVTAAHEISAKRKERMDALRSGGEPLAGSYDTYVLEGGIAVLNVMGPIMPRVSWFYEMSGATSLETLNHDFDLAMKSPDVTAILGVFDTPGGSVSGLENMANKIFKARGSKPLIAYTEGACCSGGAWLASAFDERVCTESAILGSIGVIATYEDTKKAEEMEGIKVIEIVSSNAEDKRVDPDTDEGKEKIRANLNAIEAVFIANLARNHGIKKEDVTANFGRGDIMTGSKAVKVGLANRIGFRDNLVQEIRAKVAKGSKTSASSSARSTVPTNPKRGTNMEGTENIGADGSELVPDEVTEVVAPAATQTAPAPAAASAGFDFEAHVSGLVANAKQTKVTKFFTQSVSDRVPEAARGPLAAFHAKCVALGCGMDDAFESFVEAMPPLSVTQDVLPASEAAATKVATSPEDEPKADVVEDFTAKRNKERKTEGSLKGKI